MKSLNSFRKAGFLAFSASLALLSGCLTSSNSSSAVSAVNTSTNTPVTDCTTSLIDTGQKGSVLAVARGLYSDTKMIPGTSNPSTAFVDQSALVIKFSYFNGSEFVTETVSGDGTGAFVRLAYLSDGVPMVFWTLGANLKVAIRSAAAGTPGTWTAGIIDTGVASRAVEVSVNPLNQVLVGFLTDTAATGHPKFLYCNSPCTSPANFQTMTPNAFIEATAITAAQVATGAAWCKESATTYYPALSYSVAGAIHYAVCQNTLANCLNNANWTTTNIAATTSVSTKLLLNSGNSGDVPKAVALGAAGIVPYEMGATACTAAPVAFGAGAAMGTATSGNAWMTFLEDTLGKFHLMANESTTSVRYYNSTGTSPVAAWNAPGTVETNTLTAASGGGADIDSSTDGVYVTYGINAVPFDIHLSRVTNYTAASSAATFSTSVSDSYGNLNLSASPQKNVAVAATSAGDPAVAYVDFSVGATASAKLKYALRGGSSSSSPWDWVLVPDTINPQFPALAFDSSNEVWVSFFDAATNKFYLANNSSATGSATWNVYQFPAVPAGAPIALPASNQTAVTMVNGFPLMIVIDNNAGSKGVKSALFNSTIHAWSAVTTVDPLTSGALGASFLSADGDSSGNAVVAYQDISLTKVKYSYSNAGGAWSAPLAISQPGQGPGTSIRISPATDEPAVSYYDQVNNLVIYNACSSAIASCATTGWTPVTVESSAGVSGLTNTSYQLLSASLEYGATGTAYVLYPRGVGNDGNLLMTENASGSFQSSVVADGVNGNLPGAPVLNYGIAGWSVATTRNEAGGVTAAYVGPGNWLYATSCGD